MLKYISFIIILSGFFSCSEEKRIIEPFIPAGNRIVLLEEFTGKGCTNCPKGSREIDNLLTRFPDNLVVVSIHAGFFANPDVFHIGQYDFRTTEGEFLYQYLGPITGYPSGVVDRTRVSGEIQLSSNAWAFAITKEIQTPPAIEFGITQEYNPGFGELKVTIDGIAKETVTGEVRISIMLIESGIVDAQDDFEAGGIVQDYVHNHVLRGMMTPADGAPFSDGLDIGETFNQSYSSLLDPSWNVQNMDIIAFVSLVNGSNFPVVQAAEVPLIP